MKYRAYIEAKPGKTLLGGVKKWLSEPKATRAEAEDLLWAMMDQPNAGKGEVLEIQPKRRSRRRGR